jgi:hypothetical protein
MFLSELRELGRIDFPKFSGTRVMMMPVLLGDMDSIPGDLRHYCSAVGRLFDASEVKSGTAYLTIDEKLLGVGQTHRRPGLHVDGAMNGKSGSWGGGGNPWAKRGMLIASNPQGCRAWVQEFAGEPGEEGNCDHLKRQLSPACETQLSANTIYWCGPLCVHESMAASVAMRRQLIRLSMPSDAAWFEGYSRNPLGIEPTGPILPRRRFMDME